MKVNQALRWTAARLIEAGFAPEEADSQARQLLAWLIGDGVALWRGLEDELSDEQLDRLKDAVARRAAREPLQLIIGDVDFYDLRVKVGAGVLIPRPETEMLVELALELLTGLPSPLVLDVGTGSGAIALAIKEQRPDARVFATDINPAALQLAGENAAILGLEVEFLPASLTAGLEGLDLIVSNPPYLPQDDAGHAPPELLWEPGSALYAGEDGLDVARPLISEARKALKDGGWLALELDPRNIHSAADLARETGFQNVTVRDDLAGRPRYLTAQRG